MVQGGDWGAVIARCIGASPRTPNQHTRSNTPVDLGSRGGARRHHSALLKITRSQPRGKEHVHAALPAHGKEASLTL